MRRRPPFSVPYSPEWTPPERKNRVQAGETRTPAILATLLLEDRDDGACDARQTATLLKTGVQVFQYWYEETNAILNLQKK